MTYLENTAAIVVAAGRGLRAGGGQPKQWRDLAGKPVVSWSVAAFAGCARIVVAVHPDDMAQALGILGGGVVLVAGGSTRQQSVRNALETLDGSGLSKVLIHDAARPLVSEAVISRVVEALDVSPAAAPALPVSDALWRGEDGFVSGTVDRSGLWRAQTPQGFHLDAILEAHRNHVGDAADDVEVARAAGLPVRIVAGEETNFKLTYADDFARALNILER